MDILTPQEMKKRSELLKAEKKEELANDIMDKIVETLIKTPDYTYVTVSNVYPPAKGLLSLDDFDAVINNTVEKLVQKGWFVRVDCMWSPFYEVKDGRYFQTPFEKKRIEVSATPFLPSPVKKQGWLTKLFGG